MGSEGWDLFAPLCDKLTQSENIQGRKGIGLECERGVHYYIGEGAFREAMAIQAGSSFCPQNIRR